LGDGFIKGLTDIDGIRVGHASDHDALTGCTVILCEQGAIAGADIRGSASGTAEFATLEPGHVTQRIHAVVLAGGSAFGLEAASGVRRYLASRGVGFHIAGAVVPIVPAAILFDLAVGRADVWPTREMGETAAAAATNDAVEEGSVGAGTGATVGKAFGIGRAMKGGNGSATTSLGGGSNVRVAALAAVNALGDVLAPNPGHVLAGARISPDSMDFADTARSLLGGAVEIASPLNTTLVVVATNARLSKVQATKLAQLAQIGMARAIRPVHTMSDGDVVIALSLGDLEANINSLGVAAATAVEESIQRGVKYAKSGGGVPGLAGN
jgi:L-aminopeptidase/D-esterase-like protein